MKNHLILLLTLAITGLKGYGQDTTKVQIDFQTKSNVQVPLFKHIYLGDINTSGWDGENFSYQHGTLTKNEFLFNAPIKAQFDKGKPVVLVTQENLLFTIDPENGNQKWLLTPPGQDYYKSQKQVTIGSIGLYVSTFTLLSVIINNVAQNIWYKMDKNHYDETVKMGIEPRTVPKAPKTRALYLIPAITYSISFTVFFSGKNLYKKNRPRAERIE